MRRLSVSAIAPLTLALGSAIFGAGCGSSLSQAVSELESGRPADADRTFRALESAAADFGAGDRTRYALYRGLTHLTLGDVQEAERWLDAAKRVADRDAAVITDAERGRLLAAWRTMGRMPGEIGLTALLPRISPANGGAAAQTNSTSVDTRP